MLYSDRYYSTNPQCYKNHCFFYSGNCIKTIECHRGIGVCLLALWTSHIFTFSLDFLHKLEVNNIHEDSMKLLFIISLAFILILIALLLIGIYIQKLLGRFSEKQLHSNIEFERQFTRINERLQQGETLRNSLHDLLETQQKEQQEQRNRFDKHQINSLKLIQECLSKVINNIQKQVTQSLRQELETLGKHVDKLTEATQTHLRDINHSVDRTLHAGFDKTNRTFHDVIKRLAEIDKAQQKISELSKNVVSLQSILSDKRSRGAFGEVQLNTLIRNVLPESHFSLQRELSNKMRVDCLLFFPEPTGNIAVDAKFPLESYQLVIDEELSTAELHKAKTQFRQDIRTHIQTIARKYIIPNETAEGAIMFIPAEAIFAEIHARYPDLVAEAYRRRVWLVSPTTLMAILNTARAIIKDASTRKQVHLIQKHLITLSKDFERFQIRMEKLAKHIHQAQQDVEDVHKSSQKISSKFTKIEQVELSSQSNDDTTSIEKSG